MSFPGTVNLTQAPGIAGQCASANPRHSTPGNSGAWVAGAGGVHLGRFAWGDLTSTDSVLLNTGTGVPTGLIGWEFGDAMITTYLAETGDLIPQGFPVPLFNGGDFWVKNNAATVAAINTKAFANTTDGTVNFAAAGATVAGSVETKWSCVGWGGGTGAQNEVVKISNVSLD